MDIREIQQALAAAGFDPGPIDGIRGRKTIRAIMAFQEANGLAADGIVGPQTTAKLFPGQGQPSGEQDFSVPSHMPWLQEAFRLIGTREQPGAGSNEAILGWAREINVLSYTDDDIPWCGLFVAHCIGSQLPEEPLPNNPLGARRWETFGRAETAPCLGAVMVFWRESRQSGKGHVGFYWAEDDAAYHILGGNQSNSVSVARVSKERFLAARWPDTAGNPTPVQRTADVNGRLLSQNEA
jgi:uncharacterized protein (TIGR02594 family)